IDRFQIFSTGLIAEGKIATDECDAFLDDVIRWIQEAGGAKIEQDGNAARFYASHLEAQSDVLLETAFSEFADFGHQLADVLRGYKQLVADFKFMGFTIAGSPEPRPAPFRLEHREGYPPATGIYFCVSPLRTADHLRILDSLEGILRAKSASFFRAF